MNPSTKKVITYAIYIIVILGFIYLKTIGSVGVIGDIILVFLLIYVIIDNIFLNSPHKPITLHEIIAELSAFQLDEGAFLSQAAASHRGKTISGEGSVFQRATDDWGRTVITMRERMAVLDLMERGDLVVDVELSFEEQLKLPDLKVGDYVEFSGTLTDVSERDGMPFIRIGSCLLLSHTICPLDGDENGMRVPISPIPPERAD